MSIFEDLWIEKKKIFEMVLQYLYWTIYNQVYM